MEVITISKELRVNEQIRCREIRVIDEQGSQIGVMNPRDAMKLADEKGLDLVEVSPGAKPPVCRIMDYGKYRYEQNKKEREITISTRRCATLQNSWRLGTRSRLRSCSVVAR